VKQRQKIITSLLLGLISSIALSCFLRGFASPPQLSFNALAPLEIRNEQEWRDFEQQLVIAQQMGIDAIVTDIWWGKVEAEGDQEFNWQYYDRLVKAIQSANLHWIPLLSFHQCGGNVGDDCDIPIPSWIWKHFPDVAPQALQYISEKGNASPEVVSLWADDLVIPEYQELMVAFAQRYGDQAEMIDEIQISLGSASELRYPAYNAHDNYQYPHRGYFQAYSEPAKVAFRKEMRDRYGNLPAINQAWGSHLTTIQQIQPPQQPETFVQQRDYVDTQYGRDFIDWYNQSLINHGQRILNTAHHSLNHQFSEIPLGIKIPGIHWQIAHPKTPRIAEITTGLIPTNINFHSKSTGYGYQPLLQVAKSLEKPHSREVILHYTAIELSNGRDQNLNAYSQAKDLVGWIAQTATKLGITLKGENALSGELNNPQAWENIYHALNRYQFSGFTALRLEEVTQKPFPRQKYRQLIQTLLNRACSISQKPGQAGEKNEP
jgi:hypothetical protein